MKPTAFFRRKLGKELTIWVCANNNNNNICTNYVVGERLGAPLKNNIISQIKTGGASPSPTTIKAVIYIELQIFARLQIEQMSIFSVLFQEFEMRTLFNNVSVANDKDSISKRCI